MKKEQDKPVLSDKEIDDAITRISDSVIGINFNALGLFNIEVNIGYTDFTDSSISYDAIEKKFRAAWEKQQYGGSSPLKKPLFN